MVLEKTFESPLDCKEIQPVHPKGNQSWVFIGRTDVEAETPTFWPPGVKNWLFWKDPDAGKGWGQEEKGMTKDEMVGWHHRLNGHGFGWTPGVGDGQGGLACCGSWGHKESDTTAWLNGTELNYIWDSSVDCESYSISFMELLPTLVYIMVIWIKFTHQVQFSSLILKMSMFILPFPVSPLPVHLDSWI